MSYETLDRSLRGLRVLVVDDNAALRGLLRVSLQAFGCMNVVEASSVDTALEILNSETVNLLITDWKMTPKDGIELVRTIRTPATSPAPYLPIIMLTGYSDASRAGLAKDAGVNEFLIKPFTAEALANCIRNVFRENREFISTKNFFGPDRRSEKRPDNSEYNKIATSR